MAAMPKHESAESFVSSVFKYSVSTVVSFALFGLAVLLNNFLVPNQAVYGEISQFLGATNTLMTIVIFGLDQSYIRFCYEPPGRLSSAGLFRLCFYLSTSILFVAALVCSLFLSGFLHGLFEFQLLGRDVIPLVFLNTFFWMVARYFYVLYRMEQNIVLYTLTAILMNFFNKVFYLGGAFFENQLEAMVVFSMVGLGGFALVCMVGRRKLLMPRKDEVSKGVLGVILPYGIAVAPTAILVTLNFTVGAAYVAHSLGGEARGVYSYGFQLSNIVTAIQLGFASFWGAYMYANYKTQQERIKKVHDILNLIVLVFFTLLVAFEDVIFWILANYKEVQPIFPLMMLSAVFTVLCETTTYGNTIAKKPIFDTLGNALSILCNFGFCVLLIPFFSLEGAAAALAVANLAMYLFRTGFGQYFYRTVRYPAKSTAAVVLSILLALFATRWHDAFLLKLCVCAVAALLYCLMYRAELLRCFRLGRSMLESLLARAKK
ncbi:hypothetical protein LJC49_00420 [Ruminococcaceae bacterium OttesenSCG-928-I18]|nr:hypothetical protein [Ruminococcaceae bacterium OttesenSCG-928-I18]